MLILRLAPAAQTAIDSAITVATGKELKGTGVWSWIKVDGSPVGRAGIIAAFAVVAALVSNPDLVSALTSDASINK